MQTSIVSLTFNESFLLFGSPPPHLALATVAPLTSCTRGYGQLTLVLAAIFLDGTRVLVGHAVCAQIVFEILFDFTNFELICFFDVFG